jgi:hypothetical protein
VPLDCARTVVALTTHTVNSASNTRLKFLFNLIVFSFKQNDRDRSSAQVRPAALALLRFPQVEANTRSLWESSGCF